MRSLTRVSVFFHTATLAYSCKEYIIYPYTPKKRLPFGLRNSVATERQSFFSLLYLSSVNSLRQRILSGFDGVERGSIEAREGCEVELRTRLVGRCHAVKTIADVFDSDRCESRFDGFKSLLRRVVVVRKVTEENVAQHRGIDFSNEIGGHAVVQVTVVSHDACFEIFWIATFAQHFEVIVGFDDDVSGEAHIVVDTFADATEVGSDSEADIAVADEIADVVGSVVHDIKRRDFKIADSEWKFLVDRGVVVLDAARNVVAA